MYRVHRIFSHNKLQCVHLTLHISLQALGSRVLEIGRLLLETHSFHGWLPSYHRFGQILYLMQQIQQFFLASKDQIFFTTEGVVKRLHMSTLWGEILNRPRWTSPGLVSGMTSDICILLVCQQHVLSTSNTACLLATRLVYQ